MCNYLLEDLSLTVTALSTAIPSLKVVLDAGERPFQVWFFIAFKGDIVEIDEILSPRLLAESRSG